MASRRFALALVALGPIACGGGGSLTAQEYREKGNRICREADREARRLARGSLRTQVENIADAADRSRARFERLKPPDELRDDHDEAVRNAREALHLFREAERNFERDGADALLNVIEEIGRVVRKGDVVARRLGLAACATDVR
jgi:hypothetical protein